MKSAWRQLQEARGARGLVAHLAPEFAPAAWRHLRAITAGTQAFTLRICTKAARALRQAPPILPVRIPRATDRTDPRWYRTRARGGSTRLAILRAFKRLAVTELPLLEAHLGRRESPLFRLKPRWKWDERVRGREISAQEFRAAARRWLHLMTGKATWLSLRLAQVAAESTGDPRAAVETLRVCAAVASAPRLYDPFNTFAAFLEAFHFLAARDPRRLASLLSPPGNSPFAAVALPTPPRTRWHSFRARQLAFRARGGP